MLRPILDIVVASLVVVHELAVVLGFGRGRGWTGGNYHNSEKKTSRQIDIKSTLKSLEVTSLQCFGEREFDGVLSLGFLISNGVMNANADAALGDS